MRQNDREVCSMIGVVIMLRQHFGKRFFVDAVVPCFDFAKIEAAHIGHAGSMI